MCAYIGNNHRRHIEKRAVQRLNEIIRWRDEEIERQRQLQVVEQAQNRFWYKFNARVAELAAPTDRLIAASQ